MRGKAATHVVSAGKHVLELDVVAKEQSIAARAHARTQPNAARRGRGQLECLHARVHLSRRAADAGTAPRLAPAMVPLRTLARRETIREDIARDGLHVVREDDGRIRSKNSVARVACGQPGSFRQDGMRGLRDRGGASVREHDEREERRRETLHGGGNRIAFA